MKPKEKAKELINMYKTNTVLSDKKCIQCAVMSVNLLIEHTLHSSSGIASFEDGSVSTPPDEFYEEYWREVLLELHKIYIL